MLTAEGKTGGPAQEAEKKSASKTVDRWPVGDVPMRGHWHPIGGRVPRARDARSRGTGRRKLDCVPVRCVLPQCARRRVPPPQVHAVSSRSVLRGSRHDPFQPCSISRLTSFNRSIVDFSHIPFLRGSRGGHQNRAALLLAQGTS